MSTADNVVPTPSVFSRSASTRLERVYSPSLERVYSPRLERVYSRVSRPPDALDHIEDIFLPPFSHQDKCVCSTIKRRATEVTDTVNYQVNVTNWKPGSTIISSLLLCFKT